MRIVLGRWSQREIMRCILETDDWTRVKCLFSCGPLNYVGWLETSADSLIGEIWVALVSGAIALVFRWHRKEHNNTDFHSADLAIGKWMNPFSRFLGQYFVVPLDVSRIFWNILRQTPLLIGCATFYTFFLKGEDMSNLLRKKTFGRSDLRPHMCFRSSTTTTKDKNSIKILKMP